MSDHQDSGSGSRPRVVGPIDTSSIAAALKRASSLNTGFPTRTIRITAAEQSSRDNTPNPITIDDLLNRPRSNPRLRTPMRYESPLESDAFRRTTTSNAVRDESSRITIRSSAGAAVGSIPRRQLNHEPSDVKSKSSKQGPSQRKIRRWRNENFVGLAAELSKSRGTVAADVLLKAHHDAHLYRSIYDPQDHCRSEKVNRFMTDDGMKNIREHFFEGHGPDPTTSSVDRAVVVRRRALTGDDMLHRIDPRLRRLVVRACHNSYAAAKVVQLFETFVVSSFSRDSERRHEDGHWWANLLLECPTITHRNDSGRCTAQFFFDSSLPTAGFHRLLLHAVCQFHGLNVVSRMESNYVFKNEVTNARALVATGNIDEVSSDILLLQHLGEVLDDAAGVDSPTAIVDQVARLRV